MEGICLNEPHAKWVWQLKKTAIIKSDDHSDKANKPLFLLDKSRCYGIIRLNKAFKISIQEFKDRRNEHLVSDEEAKKWWDKSELFFYSLSWVERYDEPKLISLPQENCDITDKIEFLSDLATVNPSGNKIGKEIYLKDVLSYFKTFKIKRPFLCLVGGLVANNKTNGDIDILIRKKPPSDENEDIPLKFRILRQFPKEYWNRLHFLYDDQHHGPFTDFVPIYDFVLERQPEKIEKMSDNFDPYEYLHNLKKITNEDLINRYKKVHSLWRQLYGNEN